MRPASSSDSPAPGGMTIAGPRLRAARQARGLSLADVALATGLSKGFLSLVERSRASASVPVLLRICEALGISVGSLFDHPQHELVRSGAGTPFEMGGVGLSETLLTPATERRVQVMRTLLEPGGGSDGTYTLATETVFAFVLRGRLALTVAGRAETLAAGDSLTYSARSPHAWHNPGPAVAEVLWTLAPPLRADPGPVASDR